MEKKSSFGKDFYNDIDRRARNSSCGCWGIVVVLIIIFVLLVLGGWYIKNKVVASLKYIDKPTSEISKSPGVIGKINEESASKASGDIIKVTLTDDEIADYFGTKSENFPLKSAQLNINDKGIEINGKTKNTLISMPVTIVMVPYVEEKQLKVRVESINSGVISLPKSVRDEIADYLNGIVSKKSMSTNNFELTDIKTREDFVDIFGKKI